MASIAELEFLGGSTESMDEFTELYENILNEAKIAGDKETMRKMRNLLLHQAAFLMTAWWEEEAKIRKCEQRGEVQ